MLDRLFADDDPPAESEPGSPSDGAVPDQDEDLASIRQAIADTGTLSTEQRRYLAGYAYVLARVARADGAINDDEVRVIERAVIRAGDLNEQQGVLLVAIAMRMNSLYGASEDFAVTREFARLATPQQLQRLLRACVAVGAADSPMTSGETTELYEIGRELGFPADEVDAIRSQVDPQPLEAPTPEEEGPQPSP